MTIHFKPLPIKTISPQLAYYYRRKEAIEAMKKPNEFKLNPTQLRRMGGAGYAPRQREEGEAVSNVINLMKQPRYKPAMHLEARSGIAR